MTVESLSAAGDLEGLAELRTSAVAQVLVVSAVMASDHVLSVKLGFFAAKSR